MNALVGQPWFWPALAVVIVLPLALLILGEVHAALVRRDSAYAKPVALLRNWLLPVAATYILIDQLNQDAAAGAGDTGTKIAATAVGFLIMLVMLSGANAALFGEARTGSWRNRLPGIFVDLGRLILIAIGIALLLSWVWGANIGGLITAVGVTSIVIGLAVQNAVGPVISGLLLLFEQPFRIGDWLETKFGKGRVVEVNWRAVHIDTENGVQIVPNAALAGDAFVNLSRTTAPYFKAKATLTFGADDPPGQVKATLLSVADRLPTKVHAAPAAVVALGAGKFRVAVPIASPAEEGGTTALLLHRAWYAGQRAGLHLDDVQTTPRERREQRAQLTARVRQIATALGLDGRAADVMDAGARELLYAEGELVQPVNSVPAEVGFVIEGELGMFVEAEDGRILDLGELSPGDYFGGTALTRQRMPVGVGALTDATVVAIGRQAMETVVRDDHRLARQIGEAIEIRRKAASAALAEAARGLR